MNENLKAAEEIGKFGRMFGAMVAAAEKFQEVGSLENALVEVKQAIVAEKAKLADAVKDTEAEKERTRQAQGSTQAAKDAAQKIIDDARDKAAEIVAASADRASSANEQAMKIVSDANDKAARALSDVEAARSAIVEAVFKAKQDLASVESDIKAKQAELDAINEKITKARAAAAAIIGG